MAAHGPDPAQLRQEIGIVLRVVIGMAQGREHLARVNIWVLTGERGQRLAGTDLDIGPVRGGGEGLEPLREEDRAAQMLHPVVGIGGLGVGDERAGPVRDERDLRRGQGDLAQIGAKARQDRVQQAAMGGDVDGDALVGDLLRIEPRGQCVQRGIGAGGDAERGAIHCRKVQILAQMGAQLVGRKRHGQHPAPLHAVHQLPAQMHQPDAILEADHTGQAGGGVLAHGMTDQRLRGHAPGHPELRQRIFDDHDQG